MKVNGLISNNHFYSTFFNEIVNLNHVISVEKDQFFDRSYDIVFNFPGKLETKWSYNKEEERDRAFKLIAENHATIINVDKEEVER